MWVEMNSRDKGKRGEREIAQRYAELGFDSKRTAQLQAGGDHHGVADVSGVPGIHIEVKRVESLNIWKALEQSERDAADGNIPTVHFRRNRTDWYVALPFADFARLLDQSS